VIEMSNVDRLERLEKAVGVLIGAAMGGPAGARLGASAVRLHQMSPLHELEVMAIEDLDQRIRNARAPSAQDFVLNGSSSNFLPAQASVATKKKRKPSAYSKRYGKAFKKIQSKYKKKNGQWKKDGFKRCEKATRMMAKK